MPRKIHMQDQVFNKVDDIMNHYTYYGPRAGELWAVKFMVIGAFLLMGVYW